MMKVGTLMQHTKHLQTVKKKRQHTVKEESLQYSSWNKKSQTFL